MRHNCARVIRQQGLSLIELLVATAIGLFLLAVISVVFVGAKTTYLTQDANARLQENSRYAIEFLSRQVRNAGFPLITFNLLSGDLYSKPAPITFLGEPIAGADGGATASDSITVSYDAPADCLGNAVASGTAVNLIRINATQQIECLGNGSLTPQAILDDVEDLQIRYGQKIGVNYGYLTASSATMADVNSVRICVLLRAAADSDSKALDQKQKYVDCLGAAHTSTDKYIRRTITTTIELRHRNK